MGALRCEHVAVAGGQDDRQVGPSPADLASKLQAVHPRHHHVGKDHLEANGDALDLGQRLLRVGRPDRRVAEFAQGLLGEGTDVEVVLPTEDAGAVPLARASGSAACLVTSAEATRGRYRVKVSCPRRPRSRRGSRRRIAWRSRTPGSGRARALADDLRGEERLEDALQVLRRDAGAGIADRHPR